MNQKYTKELGQKYTTLKYGEPKWVQFCNLLLENNKKPMVYFSKISVSKYISFETNGGVKLKIRFSQHKPYYPDYDFNVGPYGFSYKEFLNNFKEYFME